MESEPRVPDPRRVVVASYESYAEAQGAVDYLSDENFPMQRVAIVAEDLRLVEQVTGQMGYGRAALQGAGVGALIGAILGFFLGGLSSYVAMLWLIYGAIIGLIVGLINHALSGGRRDFSSVEGIQARRYNVVANEEVADEASQLLAGFGVSPRHMGRENVHEERPSVAREEAVSRGVRRHCPQRPISQEKHRREKDRRWGRLH
jgi:hypothetical protein